MAIGWCEPCNDFTVGKKKCGKCGSTWGVVSEASWMQRQEFEPETIDAHYASMAIQPTHYALANGLGPVEHHVIKYLSRKKHDGTRDLSAAINLLRQYRHYLETGDWLNQADLDEAER